MLLQDSSGNWHLDVGREPILRAPISGPLPFRRLELTGSPWTIVKGQCRPLRTTRAFLRALRPCLESSGLAKYFDRLIEDFDNSFANLVLNRLIAQTLTTDAQAIEPVFEGHHYYPFPALRLGPSISQVTHCSNLCQDSVLLNLVAVRPGLFDSITFSDHLDSFRAWSGLPTSVSTDIVIPLHPWQLELSPIIQELLKGNWLTVLEQKLEVVPLASQRTCRVMHSGFDVKLPIAVTLTGEDRLLYPLNLANATAFSLLAHIIKQESGPSTLDFQYDVASIAHAEPLISPHLSAIFRAPVQISDGETVIPALNLWCGQQRARTLLNLDHPEQVECFFRSYCRVLMSGVTEFYTRFGMAFEPHLQNVHVALRDGMPSRMILRDLDSTILDPMRIRPIAKANGLQLARGTWKHMPTFTTGGRRLAHAMMYGHLGEVTSFLARTARADLAKLTTIVEATWDELIAQASSKGQRQRLFGLRKQADTVGAVLWRRITRAGHVSFR